MSTGFTFNPNTQLSYARDGNGTSRQFLDAAAFKDNITVPENVLAEARGQGKDYAYVMIPVDASNHHGLATARGFHGFVNTKTGEVEELIPFVSGGATATGNLSNSSAVENTRKAVMPFLVTDQTGQGDGIHRKGKINSLDLNRNDGFGFFLYYDDGVAGRDEIGAHTNLRHDQKGHEGSSYGCPVVRPEDTAKMKNWLQKANVTSGSTYHILDPNEVVASGGFQFASRGSKPGHTLPNQQLVDDSVKKNGAQDTFNTLSGLIPPNLAQESGLMEMLFLMVMVAALGEGNFDVTAANSHESRQKALEDADIENGFVRQKDQSKNTRETSQEHSLLSPPTTPPVPPSLTASKPQQLAER